MASRVPSRARAVARKRGRLLVGGAFAALSLAGSALMGRHLTSSSWPLQGAHMGLVALAGGLYFASFILRALGWRKLFPARERPDRSRCLAACGAAAASGAVLPFRLDYLVKIGTLRRLGGVRLTLEAIALSIVTLGLVDAVAFLPLSISATATSSASFRGPLILVVLFGVGACRRLPAPGLLDDARARQHALVGLARRRVLTHARPRRPLPRCRRLADPDHLRGRDRQRQHDREHPARARDQQGSGDQLRPRLRPPALRDRPSCGPCRCRPLAHAQPARADAGNS